MQRLLKYQALEQAAMRRRDIPAANRHVEQITRALRTLSGSPLGRQRLEGLLDHPDPSTRGRAASEIIQWVPERAVPVLAKLLYEPQDPAAAAFEKVGVSLEAQKALTGYFGLPWHDPRGLVEKLAAAGSALPEEFVERRRWRD